MKHDDRTSRGYSSAIVTLFLFCLPTTAGAQGSIPVQGTAASKRVPSASPYQQRLSPYLDLLRTDNSVLGPYHSFVRPRQQLRQSIGVQATQFGQLLRDRNTVRTSTGNTIPDRVQTGHGGTFNNHLHFYQFQSNR